MYFLRDIAMFSLRDPNGGLTPAGRRHYREKTGSRLRPGVKKKVRDMSPSDMRRKSSFLMRFYGNKNKPPLVKPNGEATRHSLAASAWGEKPPRTQAQASALYRKGKRLNKKYKTRSK